MTYIGLLPIIVYSFTIERSGKPRDYQLLRVICWDRCP